MALRKKLSEKLAEIQFKNPSYSLRAFAKKIALGPGVASEILSGKRRVSPKLAGRIAERLELDPQERAEIMSLFPAGGKRPPPQAAAALGEYAQLGMDQYHVIASWHHFAILSLMNTEGFKSDPRWMAERLGISSRDAAVAVHRLERLGLIVRGPRGAFKRAKARYRTPDDIANLPLRKAQATNLELAKVSLERDPVQGRDFTSITMAIDPEKLPQAKERIRRFQDELSDFLESGKRREVFKLCMQLFPLSHQKENP